MPTMIPDDAQLLQSYAHSGSSAAFTELVQRHLPLVYHAARRHTPDRHLAEDITQEVFTLLARKADTLSHHPSLVGWLYATTRRTALHMIRRETSRHAREQALVNDNALTHPPPPAPDWDRLQPLLDESLTELKPTDRDALLLRFFENHAFSEIGRRLALSEDAARMRVERALDKLRALLQRRGFTSTSAVLTLALTTHSSAAIPTGLVATISTSALASASLSSGLLASAAKFLIMTKVQLTAASGLLVLLLTATLWQTHRLHETQRALTAATALNDQLSSTALALKNQATAAAPATAPAPLAPSLTAAELARKDRIITTHRSLLDLQYAALFRQLHLPLTDLAALKNLVVEREYAVTEAHSLARKEGLNDVTREESTQIINASRPLTDAKIRTLLGESAFAFFQNYERTLGTRNSLGPFFKELRALSTPLNDVQENQLTDLVHNAPTLPDATLESARRFLSPNQLKELKSLQEDVAARRRMIELNRAAALARKLKLTVQSAKDYPGSPVDSD